MYVPLRVHGHHSLLTGVDSPAALLARAAELGLPALALCDVDTTAGLVDLVQAARAGGVRPILGAEISDPRGSGRAIALVRNEAGYRSLCRLVSARRLGDDPGDPDEPLTCAEDAERFDLAAAAERFQDGLTFLVDHPRLVYALAPRLERRRLLVAITPAALGLRATGRVRRVGPAERRNAHLSGSGPSTAPVPGGHHGGRSGERAAQTVAAAAGFTPTDPKCPPPAAAAPAGDLVESARAVGLATLAVPDVWYARPAGHADHAARVAIRHNALVHELDPAWLAAEPAHLPSPAEMRTLYAGLPDVRGPFPPGPAGAGDLVARTLAVAEECAYTPPLGRVYFPDVALEDGETAYSRLSALAFDGARRRYRPLRPEVVRRLDHELETIERLGFAAYFLLVRRIADFARDEGIPCVGRGSAADSLVAYCLELTQADPLRYRLPFERFLNPARTDRPDIDLDFCWRRRDDVLDHVARAFGPERTAMISTLNRFGLRSAFRETALAEGVPPVDVNRWSRRLPWYVADPSRGEAAGLFDGTAKAFEDHDEPEWGAEGGEREALPPPPAFDGGPPLLQELPPALAANPLARAFAATPECKGFPFDDPRMARVLRLAAHLFDAPRHHGLHPGGVVVSPGPITDFVSCQRAAKGCVVTQHDKDGVEALGLVKMDLLGNRALTVIADCIAALREHGVAVDVERVPEDDPRTARVLAEGRTLGCFQVESPGMRHLLQQIGARSMDDCIQAVALIRPGPAGSGMKDAYVRRFRGREEPTPPHPRLAELLWDTHGVMLYQEDVMHAAALIAGMELAEADSLRRALAKRRPGHERELACLRERYFDGAAREGVDKGDAARVWERIASFASFGFCKAHAVTYGRIAYQAVYLKAHHPAPYLVAFLNSDTGYYETRVYVEEARRLGVPILPPDVNKSAAEFQLERVDGGDPGGGRPSETAGASGAAGAAIRVGLNRVKGLSQRTLERILAAREREPFVSLPDFLARTGAHTDEIEHLIQCGAFDAFDRTRPEMLWRLHLFATPARRPPRDQRLDPDQLAACRATPASRALESARDATGGWTGRGIGVGAAGLRPGETAPLFAAPETPALALPRLPELDAGERGRLELALLGLTVGAHPSRLFPCGGEERLARGRGPRPPETIPCGAFAARFAQGAARHARGMRSASVRGWLAASRRVRTSDARWMRFLTLEDESGLVEIVLFPDVYERWGHLLVSRGPFLISGTAEDQLGAVTLHAERVW
jgi:DNA-directed DNA polymerase III PolC